MSPSRMGPISSRLIRMEREEKRLQATAEERGYDSVDAMLTDMYVAQQMPLKVMQRSLYTPMWTLRRRLGQLVTMRSRGGANNVLTEVTRELVEECIRDGVNTVSDRMGVTATILSQRMKKWCEEHAPELLLQREEDEDD